MRYVPDTRRRYLVQVRLTCNVLFLRTLVIFATIVRTRLDIFKVRQKPLIGKAGILKRRPVIEIVFLTIVFYVIFI